MKKKKHFDVVMHTITLVVRIFLMTHYKSYRIGLCAIYGYYSALAHFILCGSF